jgi:outer membrane protein assembly factor BamB
MRTRSGESGASALPFIITIAVAVTLLQVPLLYKTKSGNKFSGSQKANFSAKTLAEAGIEEAISDIGRKAISIGTATDTVPYDKVGLGRGSYTTRIKSYATDPGRVEIVSTGRIGNTTRTIRARLELIKTAATIPYDTPRRSLWGIRGEPAGLYYHSLDERDSGRAWIHPEGEVLVSGGSAQGIGDFTVAPNGTMYFVSNIPGEAGSLYRIRPSDLDDNPSTPVTARLVGSTGLMARSPDEIRGLTFIVGGAADRDGVLYAVTWKSKRIYELSLENGAASFVSEIAPKGLASSAAFFCDAVSQDREGALYIARNNTKSEIWKVDRMASGSRSRRDSATLVATLAGARGTTRALAGHPDGNLYATDGEGWYRVSPGADTPSGRSVRIFTDVSDLSGMGFHFEREDLMTYGRAAAEKIRNGGQGVAGSPVMAPSDTTIRLKVVSWEEATGGVAIAR